MTRFGLVLQIPGKSSPPPQVFQGDRLVLGREVEGGASIPDPALAGEHAALVWADGELVLEPVAGKGIVRVGNAEVKSPRRLSSGEQVQLGRTLLDVGFAEEGGELQVRLEARPLRFEFEVQGHKRAGHADARGHVPAVSERDELLIGSGVDCPLKLRDPLLAGRHALLFHEDGHFYVKALRSVTGTWHNGVRLPCGSEEEQPARLEASDRLLVGYTPLSIAIHGEGDWSCLELKGSAFAFDPRAEDFDSWPLGELKLASSPALRWLNRGALLSGFLLLVLALLVRPFEEGFVDPGPLNRHHAALFAGDYRELPAQTEAQLRYREQARLAQENGCAVCHEAGERPSMESCQQCHGDLMANHHPRTGGPLLDPGPTARVDRAYGTNVCLLCHVDHRGPVSEGGSFRPLVTQTQESCARCHSSWPDGVPPEPRLPPAELEESRSVWLAYDAFPHAAHLGLPGERGGPMPCEICHTSATGEEPRRSEAGVDDRWRRDFEPVRYETCRACHAPADERVPEKLAPWHEALRPELRFDLAWHGTRDGASTPEERMADCLPCHELVAGESRRTPLPWRWSEALGGWEVRAEPWVAPVVRRLEREAAGGLRFTLQRRHHRAQFDAERCGECHVSGLPDPQRVDGTFWHAHHLPVVEQDDPGAARALSGRCLACHDRIGPGGDLAERLEHPHYTGPSREHCSTCHTPEKGSNAGLVERVLVLPPAPPRTSPNGGARPSSPSFPHGRRLDWTLPELSSGCLSCHGFGPAADAGAPHERAPTTHADARSCVRCHRSPADDSRWADEPHANLAGGNCFPCHRRGDASLLGGTVSRSWPVLNGFDHYSDGHRETTEESCTTCHDAGEAALGGAASVAAVSIPGETLAVCRECHVESRSRFHWR